MVVLVFTRFRSGLVLTAPQIIVFLFFLNSHLAGPPPLPRGYTGTPIGCRSFLFSLGHRYAVFQFVVSREMGSTPRRPPNPPYFCFEVGGGFFFFCVFFLLPENPGVPFFCSCGQPPLFPGPSSFFFSSKPFCKLHVLYFFAFGLCFSTWFSGVLSCIFHPLGSFRMRLCTTFPRKFFSNLGFLTDFPLLSLRVYTLVCFFLLPGLLDSVSIFFPFMEPCFPRPTLPLGSGVFVVRRRVVLCCGSPCRPCPSPSLVVAV